MLYEEAKFGDGRVLGVILEVDLPHRQGLLVLLIPDQQEELIERIATWWLRPRAWTSLR